MTVTQEAHRGRSLGKGLDLQHMNVVQVDAWITERRSRLERTGFDTSLEEVVQAVQDGGIGEIYDDIRGADGKVQLTSVNLLMGMWHFNPSLVQKNLGDMAEIASDLTMGVGAWREKTGEIGLPTSLTRSLEPVRR